MKEVLNNPKGNAIEKSTAIEGHIIRHSFYSQSLQNERAIDIYLPPGYEEEKLNSYPVIYMHDGNNLFDPNIAFGDVHWEVDTTIEKLLKINQIDLLVNTGLTEQALLAASPLPTLSHPYKNYSLL